MIVNERVRDYIDSLEPGRGPLLTEIGIKARENRVPIIQEETASFLVSLVELRRPASILEVGTAVGYSALLMAGAMPRDCRITTIEKYGRWIPVALENFRRAGEERISLLFGDAGEVLKELLDPYDFIFLDGAKGQYLNWLPDLLRLMVAKGVLVTDNVLQDGSIVKSRYALERRDRTIHARMREYLYQLKHMDHLATSIIPIGDGVALSVLKEEYDEKN